MTHFTIKILEGRSMIVFKDGNNDHWEVDGELKDKIINNLIEVGCNAKLIKFDINSLPF